MNRIVQSLSTVNPFQPVVSMGALSAERYGPGKSSSVLMPSPAPTGERVRLDQPVEVGVVVLVPRLRVDRELGAVAAEPGGGRGAG